MSVNRGKQFEKIVQRDISKLPNTLCYRLHDLTNGFKNSNTPSDFIVYRKPCFYFVECKTIHGASIPINNLIQLNRINALKQKVEGAYGYFIIWFVDYKLTFVVDVDFINMYISKAPVLETYLDKGFKKSINYKEFLKMQEVFKYLIFIPPANYAKVFGKYDFGDIF